MLGQENFMERIRKLFENGFCARTIAQLINKPYKEVQNYIKINNFELKKEEFSDDKIDLICELYREKVSAKQLGKKFNIDKRRVQKWAKERGELRSKNESVRFTQFNEHVFDCIDTPEKAYWLGFLYADGYNHHSSYRVNLCLKFDDIEHIKKYAMFLNIDCNKIHIGTINEQYKICSLTVDSKHLSQRLTELGCMQAKSFKITYPEWLDESLHNHFIRGMFDGDGCLTCRKTNKEWKWSLVSTKEGCDKIIEIFKLNIGVNINCYYISKTENNTYDLTTNGNEKILKIMDWLYKGCSDKSMLLDRKYSKYLLLKEQQQSRGFSRKSYKVSAEDKVKMIELVKSGKTYVEVAELFGVHPRTVSKLV